MRGRVDLRSRRGEDPGREILLRGMNGPEIAVSEWKSLHRGGSARKTEVACKGTTGIKLDSTSSTRPSSSFRLDSIHLDDQPLQPTHQTLNYRSRLRLPLELLDPPSLAQHSHDLFLGRAGGGSLNRLEVFFEEVCEGK